MDALITGDHHMRDLGRAARRLALIMLVLAAAACGKKPDATPVKGAALTVTASTVNIQALPRKVDASGSVAAWQEVPVSSETGGLEVTAVLADEGSRVREGQQLVQLDDRV